jgi:hypothetical protein
VNGEFLMKGSLCAGRDSIWARAMLLTLKGVLLGTAIFIILGIAYVALQVRSVMQESPSSTVGIDVNAIALWTVRNPVFWVWFVLMVAFGIAILRWKHWATRREASPCEKSFRLIAWRRKK